MSMLINDTVTRETFGRSYAKSASIDSVRRLIESRAESTCTRTRKLIEDRSKYTMGAVFDIYLISCYTAGRPLTNRPEIAKPIPRTWTTCWYSDVSRWSFPDDECRTTLSFSLVKRIKRKGETNFITYSFKKIPGFSIYFPINNRIGHFLLRLSTRCMSTYMLYDLCCKIYLQTFICLRVRRLYKGFGKLRTKIVK